MGSRPSSVTLCRTPAHPLWHPVLTSFIVLGPLDFLWASVDLPVGFTPNNPIKKMPKHIWWQASIKTVQSLRIELSLRKKAWCTKKIAVFNTFSEPRLKTCKIIWKKHYVRNTPPKFPFHYQDPRASAKTCFWRAQVPARMCNDRLLIL